MTTPQQIGKYRILDEIASGAQGAVYRAIDPSTAMTVAVKVLIGQRVTDVERLRREASLAQNSPAPEQGRAKFNFSMVPPAGLEPTA